MSMVYESKVNADGKCTSGAKSKLIYILPFLAIFVSANTDGFSWTVGLAVLILCVIATFVLNGVGSRSNESPPTLLPVGLYCIGMLIFHFGWGTTHLIQRRYVAGSLLWVCASILAVYFGAWVGKAQYTDAVNEKSLPGHNHRLLFSVSLILLLGGWLIRFWALKAHLIGFPTVAFGINFDDTGRFVTMALALRELVGVGQVVLLAMILRASKNAASTTSSWRLLSFSLLVFSFSLDLVFSLQSAAKGEILGTFVPVLVTIYAFGNRKTLFALLVVGLILSAVLVFPLANDLRYDSEYHYHLQRGSLFLPSLDDLEQALSYDLESLRDVQERFNQTSLLAFSIQRRAGGLPSLGGRSYLYAVKTLFPRALLPQRIDRKISYDFYTGYVIVFRGYNNWGMHTEAYLNFGVLGVVVVMTLAGFVWQQLYQWLLRFHTVMGWAIAASILLPSILRASEFGFLSSTVSMFKSLLFVTVISKVLIAVVRVCLMRRDGGDLKERII